MRALLALRAASQVSLCGCTFSPITGRCPSNVLTASASVIQASKQRTDLSIPPPNEKGHGVRRALASRPKRLHVRLVDPGVQMLRIRTRYFTTGDSSGNRLTMSSSSREVRYPALRRFENPRRNHRRTPAEAFRPAYRCAYDEFLRQRLYTDRLSRHCNVLYSHCLRNYYEHPLVLPQLP